MKTTQLICLSVLLGVLVCAGACSSDDDFEYDEKASGRCFTTNATICSSNCKQVLLCLRDDADVFDPVVVRNCSSGFYCDTRDNTCRLGLTSCSPTNPPVFRLHCTATGLFPDPWDCSVFHTCQIPGVLSEVKSCTFGWAYNARSLSCNLRFDSRTCTEGPIPKCLAAGQTGPVVDNPNIYYICLAHLTGPLPEYYRCENHAEFVNGACVYPEVTTQ